MRRYAQTRSAEFQSTRPVWGATASATPHFRRQRISIHAPRVGRDHRVWVLTLDGHGFQSTRPVWGATSSLLCRKLFGSISIHAPRVGRDMLRCFLPQAGIHFNPRAPCGARRQDRSMRLSSRIFQSTRPRGARQVKNFSFLAFFPFQSTRPRGARLKKAYHIGISCKFQSTRPRGARPCLLLLRHADAQISIHAPAWGATCSCVPPAP